MIDDSHFYQNTDNSTELPEITSGAQQINIASLSTVPTTNSGEMFYMNTDFHTFGEMGRQLKCTPDLSVTYLTIISFLFIFEDTWSYLNFALSGVR